MNVKIIHEGRRVEHLRSIGVFVRSVEVGSLAGAAAALGLTPSAVSKSISALERTLNARLFMRSTRGISLTDEGARFYEQCSKIVADLKRAEEEISQSRATPRGILRVVLHVTPARFRILPALPRFVAENPELQLEVRILAGARSVKAEGIDVGVFIGDPPESNLVARRVADLKFVLTASRAYIARSGVPSHPKDLAVHNCMTYLRPDGKPDDIWSFERNGEICDVQVRGNARINDGQALVDMAVAGLGIVRVIRMTADPQIFAGALVPILTDWTCEAPPIHMIYAKGTTQSARVRAFVNFVADLFSDLPASRTPRRHWPMRRG